MIGYNYEANGGGFIVSHEEFDYGANPANYYFDNKNDTLMLSGLPQNSNIRLWFHFFDLHPSQCDDILEIAGIKGYPGNNMRFCGYDDPTRAFTDLYPTSDLVSFNFHTRSLLGFSRSAGFLIEYQGDSARYLNKFHYLSKLCISMRGD